MFRWGARAQVENVDTPAPRRIVETLSASRALPKLLVALQTHESPILLDLGPVVGANVSFFGERLSCKLLIEDLRVDIAAAIREGRGEELPAVLAGRIHDNVPQPVHGILCWDLFDCLDRNSARTLATSLCGVLRPQGVLHGLFGTRASTGDDSRTKFIVESETALRCRREPAEPLPRYALQTGEINRMFPSLSTIESVLLQTHTREVLFRKS
jgi:hypothetical protein